MDKKRLQYYHLTIEKVLNDTVVIVFFSIFCARLFYLIVEEHTFSLSILFSYENWGISLIGGVIGGLLSFFFLYKNKFFEKINFYSLYVPLINVFGRLGCYYSDCCHGIILGFDLRIIVFFYYLLLFLLFYYFRYFLDKKNNLIFLYLFFVGLERCLFDYFRLDKVVVILSFITRYQIIGSVIMFLSISYFILNLKKTKNK